MGQVECSFDATSVSLFDGRAAEVGAGEVETGVVFEVVVDEGTAGDAADVPIASKSCIAT